MKKTAILPGGFKPPHAGHYAVAKYLAKKSGADVIVRVGSGERDGITQNISIKIWEMYGFKAKPAASNSPITDVFEYVGEEAIEGEIVYVGTGKKDFPRFKVLTDPSFKPDNYKKYNPKGIKVIEIPVPPQAGGIAGKIMRGFIKNNDKESFQNNLPDNVDKDKIWNMVTNLKEDLYDPSESDLDFMRSSEYKAGYSKEDIPRSYKYKRGGIYGIMYEVEQELEELMIGMMTEPEKRKHAKNLKRLNKDLKKQGNQYMKVPDYLKGTLTRKLYEISADVIDSFDIQDTLVTDIWEDNKLKPEIRKKLILIAQDFFNSLELPENTILKDIKLTGSLANYNWSKFSDVDLHLVLDYSQVTDNEKFARDYFLAKKSVWNQKHDIDIFGYPVEVYVEDEGETHTASGLYSVLNDKWITEPVLNQITIDKEDIKTKAEGYLSQLPQIKLLFKNGQYQEVISYVDRIKERLRNMRASGLEKGGEYSVENLAFKVLRRTDFIGELNDLKTKSYDTMMSLNEEKFANHSTSAARIDDIIIPLEVADTPEKQVMGMAGRDEMKGGMVFPYNQVSQKDFHMEGCKIPLDIIFIKGEKITKIHHNCPPCKQTPCPKYSGMADNVLELPGGYCKKHNIKVGNEVNLNLVHADDKPIYPLKEKIDKKDVKQLDTFADKQLDPVDVDLTSNHFFDRLNDPRNDKEISNAELIGFFKRLGKKKKELFDFLSKFKEIVASDDRTDINIPFLNQTNKIIAKTILRKKDFQTSNPQISLERKLTKGELKDRERIAKDLPDKEFKKRYGKDWKSVKIATATKLAKKNENYPPYKADQVQKVRYQASDTFTNSPKQAKKRGYLEEIGIDLSNYKGQILPGDVLRAPKGFPLGGKKLEKSIQLKVVKNSREGVNRYKLSLEDKNGKKYTVRNFQMDGEYKGKKLPKWGLVRKSKKNIDEGDTYEKMAAKGKKRGNLKQGTVRKRLNIPKGKKIPLSLINKEISRLKKMKNRSEKNNKYLKALNLAKTLKTTTHKENIDPKAQAKHKGKSVPYGSAYEPVNEAYPKKGTGKKPKGSGRRLYTDEDPSDTVKVKFSTRQDIVDTLSKKSFKAKSHARKSQIINLIHQRVRAALGRTKDPQKKKRLRSAFEYIKKRKEASKRKTKRMKKENVFTKNWWAEVINEILLTEGGAAGHMAHPFNLPDVNNGKQLLDVFKKSADSLDKKPGAVKIDGVNSSVRLVDLDGKKQFVMDRGSKMALDVKGITKDDLKNRFKEGHGMIKVGEEVLDIFNEALPSLETDLKKLGAFDNPNILFNMEYVDGKTNVQDYGSKFIAIHGLNEIEGERKEPGQRESKEISYDKTAFQSLLDNLKPTAEKRGYEVYGSVPTTMKKKPNFNSALSKKYTINAGENSITKSLGQLLDELDNIPEEDFIGINVGYKAGSSTRNIVDKKAVSKIVYQSILNGENIDGLFEDAEDRKKAVQGFTTYLATEKLGDEVLKVLDSPMGSADKHEGVVIRDESIASVPFKITGKFILGGMASDF